MDDQYFGQLDIINFDDLKLYDYFELYNANKIYNSLKAFEYDFGKGYKQYKWKESSINGKRYIIAEEYLTPYEIDKLSNYCQCYSCTKKKSFFDRLFNIDGGEAAKLRCCLKYDYSEQYTINKTREFMKKNNIK